MKNESTSSELQQRPMYRLLIAGTSYLIHKVLNGIEKKKSLIPKITYKKSSLSRSRNMVLELSEKTRTLSFLVGDFHQWFLRLEFYVCVRLRINKGISLMEH